VSTVEPDGLVRNTEVIQPRLLCDDQIRTGELVVPSKNYREWSAAREGGSALRVQFGGQHAGPQNYAIRIRLSASQPPRHSRRSLRESHHPQLYVLPGNGRKNLFIELIEVSHVVVDFAVAIFGRHPRCTHGRVGGVRSCLWRSEVIARESFGCDEEAVVALERQEPRQKPRRQLSMTVTHDPHFAERSVERAHHGVPRRTRDSDMALFEAAHRFR